MPRVNFLATTGPAATNIPGDFNALIALPQPLLGEAVSAPPPPRPPPSPVGWLGVGTAVLASPVILVASGGSFTPQGFIQSIFPDGWRSQQPPDLFARPFPASAQQWAAFQPAGFITSIFPDEWRGYQYEVRFAQPFPAADQQWAAFQPAGFIASTFPDGWRGHQYEVRFATPFPVGDQQYAAQVAQRVRQAVDAQGFFGWQFDYQFSKPFPIGDQPFTTAPEPEQFLPGFGWYGYQLETRFAQAFPTCEQQYAAQVAQRVRQAVDAQGFFGWQWDYRFTPSFPIGEQQFQAPPSRHVPLPVDAQGFFGLQWDYWFAKPFPVGDQPFTTAPEPEQFLPGFGWWGYQLEARFAQPFPAASQVWTSYQPRPVIPTPLGFGWWGYQLEPGPAAQRAPFPVASQLFQAWPAEEVPLFLPPGAGRRRDFPPWIPQPPYGVKPQKPFRPIWDRGAETADISAEIEPRPVPPVPAEIFARAPIPRLDGFVLPSFDHLVPPDVEDLARRYRAAMDASDAAAVLEAFANQPPEAEPAPQGPPEELPSASKGPSPVPIIVPAPPIGAPPDQHLRDAEDIRAVMLRLMGGQPEPQSAALRTTVHRRASPRIVPAPAIGAEDPERDARDIEDILRILTAAGLGKK